MTREDILYVLRKNQQPEDAALSDDDLLYKTADAYDKMGRLDEFPALKMEKVRQDADVRVDDRGFIGDIVSAGKRGFSNLQQGFNVVQGATDPQRAQNIADAEMRIAANPPSKEYQQFQSLPKENIGDWLTAFAKHPVQIIAETVAESFGASIPSMAGGFVGGAIGAARAPGSAPARAIGAAIGAGSGSFAVEAASKMMDVMREKGMNPADPESVVSFFSDPQKVEEAKALGIRRGIPVGLFDGLTAGFAGRYMKPVLEARAAGQAVPVGKIVGATAKEIGLQAFGGASGEFGGQVASGEQIDPRSIFLEGVAEVGSGPHEILSNVRDVRGMKPEATPKPTFTPQQTVADEVKAPIQATVPAVQPFFNAQIPATETPASQAAAKTTAQAAPQAEGPVLASEQAKTILRARGVDETTLAIITEDEAQQLIAQTGAPVAQPKPTVTEPPQVQIAATQRQQAENEANLALQRAEDEAAARAELEAGQQEFVDPAALQRARDRAAAIRGVRIGGQMNLVDESIRSAVAATKPVTQQEQDSIAEAKEAIASRKREAATGQMGLFDQPQPAAAKPTVAPVETPAAAPVKNPAAAPVQFSQSNIQRVLPSDTKVGSVEGLADRRVAALANDVNGNWYLIPVVEENGRPTYVAERATFKNKTQLVEKLAEDLAGEGMQKTSLSFVKRLILTDSPFKDGKVDPTQITAGKSANTEFAKQTREKWIAIAQRAVDMGLFKQDKFFPLSDYAASNGLTVQRIVTTDQPITEGIRPVQVSASSELMARTEGQEAKAEYSGDATLKMYREEMLNQHLNDSGILNKMSKAVAKQTYKRFIAITELLSSKNDKYIATLREQLANPEDQPDKLMKKVDTLVSARDGDSVAFKIKLINSALDAVEKIKAFSQAAKVDETGKEAVTTQVAPVASPAPTQTSTQTSSQTPKVSAKAAPAVADIPAPVPKQKKKATVAPVEVQDAANEARVKALLELPVIESETAYNRLLKFINSRKKGESFQAFLERNGVKADSIDADRIYEVVTGRIDDYQAQVPAEKVLDKSGRETVRRVEPGVREARKDLRHPSSAEGYLATNQHDLVDRIIYEMQRRGLKVTVAEATSEIKAGGIYSPSKRSVALILESIVNPNRQAVLNALHEITHDILAEAPEEIHKAVHDAIERTPNGKLAFFGNKEADPRVTSGAGLTPEQLAIERAVEHLTLLNVDREYASGLVQAIFRAVKEAFLRAAIYVQKTIVGENNVTGEMAQAWVNNEIARVLAGDKKTIDGFLLNFGVRPTFAEAFRMVHNERDRAFAVKVDLNNRGMMFMPSAELEAATKNMDAAFESAKRTAQANGTWSAARDAELLKDLFGEDVLQRDPPSMESVKLVRDAEGNLLAPNGKASRLTERQWKLVRTPEFKNWFGDWQNDPTNASKVVDENGEPLVVYHGTRNVFAEFDRTAATEESRDYQSYNDVMSVFGDHFAVDPVVASNFAMGVYGNSQSNGAPNVQPVFLNIRNVADVGSEVDFKRGELYAQNVSTETVDRILENEAAPEEALVAMPGDETETASERASRYDRDERFRRQINEQASREEANYEEPVNDTDSALAERWRRSNPDVQGIRYINESDKETRGAKSKVAYVVFENTNIKSAYNPGTFFADDPDTMRRLSPDFSDFNTNMAVQPALKEAMAVQAVANSVHPIVEELYQKFRNVQPDLTDEQRAALKRAGTPAPAAIKSIEEFYALIGMTDPRVEAEKAHTHLAEIINAEFKQKIDPTKTALFDRSVTMDKLDGTTSSNADVKLMERLAKTNRAVARMLRKTEDGIVNLSEEEPRRRATVRSAMDALSDAKATRRILNQSIAEYFRQMARDIRRAERIGVGYGQAAGILEGLENQAKAAELAKRYTDRLFNSVQFAELPLHSIFTALHNVVRKDGLILSESSVQSIRDAVIGEVRLNPKSELAPLVELGEGPGSTDKAKALLAALINFAKTERFTSEVLQIQLMQGEERARAINELRAIYKESNERVLSDLAEQVKNATTPTADPTKLGERPMMTENLARELLDARDEALKDQATLARMERDKAVLESARNVFGQLTTAAEQRLRIGSAFVMAENANYIDAGTVDDSDAVLLEKAKSNQLKFEGKDAMTPEQMMAIIHRNEAWVDARRYDTTKQGRVYWSLQRQNHEMRRLMFGAQAREFNGGLLHHSMTGLGEVFLQTGTRAGERIANGFTQMVGWSRAFEAKAEVSGKAYEQARDAFENISGAHRENFKNLFFNPALHFLQTYNATDFNEAFAELDRRFRSDQTTAAYWSKPGSREAFLNVLQRTKESIRLVNDLMQQTGANRVRDERLTGNDVFSGLPDKPMERRQIETGVPGFTIFRHIDDELKNWASDFRSKLNKERANPFDALGLKTALVSATEKLSGDLRALFDDKAWNVFLDPMLRYENAGVVGPERADKVRAVVTPRIVNEALAESGRDLVALADKIYDRVGRKDDVEGRKAYRADFLNWIYKRWKFVDATTEPLVTLGENRVSAPSLGIDARTADFMPQEWVSYPQFTPEDNRKTSHAVTITGAFGRNLEMLTDGIKEIESQISARQSELGALRGRLLSDPAWQDLKRNDKAEYKRLKKIKEYQTPGFGKIVGDILNTEGDAWTQQHLIRELFATSVVGMVAGLKTAVKNMVSTSNLFLIQRSASPEVYKSVAGAYAKTGKLFLGSLTQLFRIDILKDEPHLQALLRTGAFDSQNHVTFAQNIKGERGVNDSITGLARALRVMRSVFTNTTLSPVKGGTAPALRLLNPFQFTQKVVNMANNWQLLETYYDMAYKAAEVYRENPKETRLLTAEDVGMRDKTAFEARRQLLLDNGTSIEEMAQKMAKGKDPLDDRTVMAINNISTTLLANEASVINRPLLMMRSKLAQMSGTFVGWGLDQTHRTLKMLETPQGRVDMDSILRGAAVLGLTMLPASLAYAALLDKWDELVEKKQNRRSVTEGISAWPEAVASVGTFGLVGDLTDYVASMRQGSSGYNDALSLDNRIVFVSSARAGIQAIRNFGSVGLSNVNYANVMRPLLQSAGAGGILQNAYILDKITGNALQEIPVAGGVIKVESGLALRTNMYNYLRAAGREAGMEVRSQQGGAGYSLTAMSPHITDMVIAALQNDRAEFQKAYREAVLEARAEGKLDPLGEVQRKYASRHPYKILFNGVPTELEVSRMRRVMGEKGSAAVAEGLRNFDMYGASIGVEPFRGSTGMSNAQLQRQLQRNRDNTSEGLGDVLARAMQLRSSESDF